MTANPATASVEVGKTIKISGSVAPADATDKSVTYKSSDEAIATVKADGTVTGIKAGKATITLTSKDGGKSATSSITVTDPEPSEEGA